MFTANWQVKNSNSWQNSWIKKSTESTQINQQEFGSKYSKGTGNWKEYLKIIGFASTDVRYFEN